MKLTIEFLNDKFNKFNKMFFNNELPPIKLSISRTRKIFGSYHYYRGSVEIPIKISISNYYDQTEVEYCNTLIHEMIHYYISYKCLAKGESTHGLTFQTIMSKINMAQKKYRITISGSSKGLISRATMSGKEHTILFFEYNGKRYLSKVSGSLTDKETVERRFGNVKVIKFVKTTSPEAEKMVSRKTRLSTIPVTTETLNLLGIAA